MLNKTLKDILDHTHGLGFIDMVKVTGNNKETAIEAMDASRSVVVYGKLRDTVTSLDGVIGLARMGVLSGYLKFPPFQDPSAKIEVVHETRNAVEVPSEIKFTAPGGHKSTYRFMSSELVEEQIKVPVFRGTTWDVTITPNDGNIKDLSYFSGILGQFEQVFVPRTVNNKLVLGIGSGSNDRADVPFAHDVSGSLAGRWGWPISETLAILKLATRSDNCVMSFSEKGAMKIQFDSECGTFEYILPAKAI